MNQTDCRSEPKLSLDIGNYSSIEHTNTPTPTPVSKDAASSPQIQSTTSLNQFDVVKVLGQGGYGKVYLVRQKDTSKLYAMKVLKKASLIIHKKTIEHTKSERQILSQLDHHFIVTLHYAFQTPDRLCLILQYAPGGSLFGYLAQEIMFSETVASFYIGEVLLALEHLHGLGIIYRDLKPENVLLDEEGHVLLTDFGLSKVALETRTVCGTIEYMAPEVLDESVLYGVAVDYWSLGVMLFDLVTGRPPFRGPNRRKVMESIILNKPKYPNFMSSQAVALVKGLLNKKPDKRIGCGPLGALEVKQHAFFRKMDWILLAERKGVPPITPELVDMNGSKASDAEIKGGQNPFNLLGSSTNIQGNSLLSESAIPLEYRDKKNKDSTSHFEGFSFVAAIPNHQHQS
ncbi:kinase-like protein [Rhizoclosmatium globosum]|uniref:Kinase-like protein n=1 Tax=Rhizoclosmatium globosum TaxID=329046 RepID=A0A1Y2CAE3_9FUNG|nr:kinase-like protein [Rhizoclosmatium globosum]|eukprot:ORY44002.1 kinase-like protein [Rhizoclosmatium globosum]